MPPRTAATTSSAALALADEPNSSGEAVPPLAFDTEDELRAVLDRLRDDLRGRVKERCEGAEQKGSKGKGRAQPMSEADRKKVDDLVLKVSRAGMVFRSVAGVSSVWHRLDPQLRGARARSLAAHQGRRT